MISLRFDISIDGDVVHLKIDRDVLLNLIPAMQHYLSGDVFVMNETPMRIHSIGDNLITFKATRHQISQLVRGMEFEDGDKLGFDISSWNFLGGPSRPMRNPYVRKET